MNFVINVFVDVAAFIFAVRRWKRRKRVSACILGFPLGLDAVIFACYLSGFIK
jgi:hypothetical protein